MPEPTPTPTPCAICRKPVNLQNCNTDENGKAVHCECMATKLTKRKPPASSRMSYRPKHFLA
jgi:hypothetical protein